MASPDLIFDDCFRDSTYLLNDGPHQFRVGKLDPATHNLKEAWKISSEDETFSLVCEEIWFCEEGTDSDRAHEECGD